MSRQADLGYRLRPAGRHVPLRRARDRRARRGKLLYFRGLNELRRLRLGLGRREARQPDGRAFRSAGGHTQIGKVTGACAPARPRRRRCRRSSTWGDAMEEAIDDLLGGGRSARPSRGAGLRVPRRGRRPGRRAGPSAEIAAAHPTAPICRFDLRTRRTSWASLLRAAAVYGGRRRQGACRSLGAPQTTGARKLPRADEIAMITAGYGRAGAGRSRCTCSRGLRQGRSARAWSA